jgi:hypothetical protein
MHILLDSPSWPSKQQQVKLKTAGFFPIAPRRRRRRLTGLFFINEVMT